jgi:hypothetical protein
VSTGLSYRESEVGTICKSLSAGDSCSVVGVSGVGKSNLCRYLLQPETQQAFIAHSKEEFLFFHVDGNAVATPTETEFYQQILESIDAALPQSAELTGEPSDLKRQLSTVVNRLCRTGNKLVFLFDQFDGPYRTLPPRFFSHLRFLRDENKYQVSYVLFTREELPRLSSSAESEEFYELVSSLVLGLGPHNDEDALLLLDRIMDRYSARLAESTCRDLIRLSGGHAGILRALCLNALRQHQQTSGLSLDAALAIDDVKGECQKIWESLPADEQAALQSFVGGGANEQHDSDVWRRLKLKKLTFESNNSGKRQTLAPVFNLFLQQQVPRYRSRTRLQAGPIRIDEAGDVWINGYLIAPPLTKKEQALLAYLCVEPGRLTTKDEIVAVVYPEQYQLGETVSDEALNVLVRRLRERVDPLADGKCRIATIRGKGYRLEVG